MAALTYTGGDGMTRRDYATALTILTGGITILTGFITGHLWPIPIGAAAFITGLLTLDQGDKQ